MGWRGGAVFQQEGLVAQHLPLPQVQARHGQMRQRVGGNRRGAPGRCANTWVVRLQADAAGRIPAPRRWRVPELLCFL